MACCRYTATLNNLFSNNHPKVVLKILYYERDAIDYEFRGCILCYISKCYVLHFARNDIFKVLDDIRMSCTTYSCIKILFRSSFFQILLSPYPSLHCNFTWHC